MSWVSKSHHWSLHFTKLILFLPRHNLQNVRSDSLKNLQHIRQITNLTSVCSTSVTTTLVLGSEIRIDHPYFQWLHLSSYPIIVSSKKQERRGRTRSYNTRKENGGNEWWRKAQLSLSSSQNQSVKQVTPLSHIIFIWTNSFVLDVWEKIISCYLSLLASVQRHWL